MARILRLIVADLESRKRQNRSNSALPGALLGKIARSLLPGIQHAARTIENGRLLRYDAAPLTGPIVDMTESDEVRFFPICFTCARHFQFARFALLSLAKAVAWLPEVAIWMDKGDPFSKDQRGELRSEIPIPISFHTTKYAMSAGGPGVVVSELLAFRQIARRMTAQDYVMKFDSDVLFTSDLIFQSVLSNRLQCLGARPPRADGRADYMQGGCYFVRGDYIDAIILMPLTQVMLDRGESHLPVTPEDTVISELLIKAGAKISHTAMIRDAPIERSELAESLLTTDVSVMHFEAEKKASMQEAIDVLMAAPRSKVS